MIDRVFVDTNVLVYLFDESEPRKREQATRRIESERRISELVISTQILQELYNALTRGQDPIRSPEDAEAAVREAARLVVVQVDPPLIFQAIGDSLRHRISFWDALVIAAAHAAGCTRLLSEDLNHGQIMGTLRTDNPFMASPDRGGSPPYKEKRRRSRGPA